jgi:hypothetical protein
MGPRLRGDDNGEALTTVLTARLPQTAR